MSWLPWVDDKDDKDSAKAKEEELEPVDLERFDATVKLDRVWSTKIGKGLGKNYLRARPAILADRIYAADGYGVVMALDRFTGKKVWKSEVGSVPRSWNPFDRKDPSFVTGALGVAHGMVLLGTTHGDVVALSATDGQEIWRIELNSEILAPPVGAEDVVLVATEDGRLVALEKDNGAVRWSFENPVPVLMLRGSGMPVYWNGLVFAGFANGNLSAIRAATGEPVWQHRVMLPEGRSELERMVDVDSTPLISGPLIFVVSYQGRLKALQISEGSPVWEREMSGFLDLAGDFSTLIAVDADDRVISLEQQSGSERWQQEGLLRRQLASPVVVGGNVVVADFEGYLHVLSNTDGSFVGRRRVDRDGVRSPIITSDGVVYVLGNSGSLEAFEIKAK